MSLYKRYGNWYISLYTRSGKRVRYAIGTQDRSLAMQLHDEQKAKLWRQENLGEKPYLKWDDLAVAYLKESAHKASYAKIQQHTRKLREYLAGVLLEDITMDTIERIKSHRLNDGVVPGTVNRMLEVLRAMLNSAVDREWLEKAPKVRMLTEPKHRPRWLTDGEESRLLAELPDHLTAMVRFSLATGLREQNVVGLRWDQIDLGRKCAWVYGDQSKTGHPIAVPLNSEAMAVLREQRNQHSVYVFTYKGRPLTRANNSAWKKALQRAGLTGFKWHQLRSTWASRHIMSGTSAYDLQQLGGWQSQAMVRRYAALSAEHLANASENVCSPLLDPVGQRLH